MPARRLDATRLRPRAQRWYSLKVPELSPSNPSAKFASCSHHATTRPRGRASKVRCPHPERDSFDIGELHDEFVIEPPDLATHKEPVHRKALRIWMAAHPELVAGRDEDALWVIRERCIEALAE